ncbi:MAG TPA: hypothetical protein VN033_12750 [Vulgatibacter sp.]|nr:hypothetical protein [Vulgatibacter sp.]
MRRTPWLALVFAACATAPRPAPVSGGEERVARAPLEASATTPPEEERRTAPGPTRWVDSDLGFEIERPPGDEWEFTPGHDAPEGIVVPVIVLHLATGAQVVVQVAPDVAPAQEFAERLAVGLRSKPGFETTVPEPTRKGSAFRFTMGDTILGSVGITGNGGRLYVLLGTWPASAPPTVERDVHLIMASLKTVVLHEARARR